ncbi:MAG: DnaB-like helicase C-terminal domain-containing protein [Candidatus Woesearchaeota archaeon]
MPEDDSEIIQVTPPEHLDLDSILKGYQLEELKGLNTELDALANKPYEPTRRDMAFLEGLDREKETRFTPDSVDPLDEIRIHSGRGKRHSATQSLLIEHEMREFFGLGSDEELPDYKTIAGEMVKARGLLQRERGRSSAFLTDLRALRAKHRQAESVNRSLGRFAEEHLAAQRELCEDRKGFRAIPPSNVKAEEAVLGLYFKHPELMPKFNQKLLHLMLYSPHLQGVHGAMMDIFRAPTVPLLAAELLGKGKLDSVGGEATLRRLFDEDEIRLLDTDQLDVYISMIQQAYLARAAIAFAQKIRADLYKDSREIPEMVGYIRQKAFEMLDILPHGSRFSTGIEEDVEAVMESFDNLLARAGRPVVSTGYRKLDRITHGWNPGKLHVVGGDTKMGKTTLMANLASNVAMQGNHVLVFAYDSSKYEIIKKLIAMHAVADSELFEYFEGINPADVTKISETARNRISRLPIIIDDTMPPDLDHIIMRTTHLKQLFPDLALVIVDSMQSFKGYKPYEGTKTSIYTEVLRGLRDVAVKSQVSVLLTGQIKTTQVHRRPTKRPYRVDDFADCNDIPKFANSAWFIWRPEEYIGQGGYFNAHASSLRGWMLLNPCVLRIGSKRGKSFKLYSNMATAQLSETKLN